MCISFQQAHNLNFSDDIVGLSGSTERWNLVDLPSNLQTILWFKSITMTYLYNTASLTSPSDELILEYKPTLPLKSELFTECSACHFNPLMLHFLPNSLHLMLFLTPSWSYSISPSSWNPHYGEKKYFSVWRNVQPYDPERLSILFLPPHENFHLSLSNYNSGFFHCL